MSIEEIIAATPSPNTRESLVRDFHAIGVKPSSTLLVHSSLSALGWVIGGPVAVIQALMDVITLDGTLVMPSQSGDLSDPEPWSRPPVPAEFWPLIREHMPAFNPQTTPTRGMGQIAELFRTYPDVKRSYHPTSSFTAWGRNADQIVANHSLAFSLGENSPLARMEELNGYVFLLGVGYDNNTCFHLSQYRAQPSLSEIDSLPENPPTPPGIQSTGVISQGSKLTNQQSPTTNRQLPATILCGSPIFENGNRVWKTYLDIDLDAEQFPTIGAEFEKTGQVIRGKVGIADARLFSLAFAVKFATEWLSGSAGFTTTTGEF